MDCLHDPSFRLFDGPGPLDVGARSPVVLLGAGGPVWPQILGATALLLVETS